MAEQGFQHCSSAPEHNKRGTFSMYATFSRIHTFNIFQMTGTMLGTGDTTVKRHGIFRDVYRPLRGDKQHLQSKVKEESISKSLWESQEKASQKVVSEMRLGS